ncbi:MAG: hypothetical protein MJ213_03750 [Bacilli bacterium]|nr:hypothetical protein [Bacilli bacterium]
MDRAYMENAQIVTDDGNRVSYHDQCPKCGHVNIMTTCYGNCRHGTTNLGYGKCPKCGASFPVVLHRGI